MDIPSPNTTPARPSGITITTNHRNRNVLVDHADEDGDRLRIRGIDDGHLLVAVHSRNGEVESVTIPVTELGPLLAHLDTLRATAPALDPVYLAQERGEAPDVRVASCGVTPKDSGPRWGDPVTSRCECGINDHDHALCQKSRPVTEVTEPLAEYAVCAYCLKFWRARHWVTDYGPQGYAVRYLETSS